MKKILLLGKDENGKLIQHKYRDKTMNTQTAEELSQKFLNLYHSFTISDEWEGNLQDDATKIALEHTTTQIEALRERLKEPIELPNGVLSYLCDDSIDQVINQFLKELSDGK